MRAKPKIFISYAKEDVEIAKRLYHDLKNKGLSPWLDIEELLAGQNWRVEINEAIKNSDYFLAILSSNSITKKGYVQKELKVALELLDEFPQSAIFIIPVRVDECNPVESKLLNIQWADLFPDYESGLNKIVKSIKSKIGNGEHIIFYEGPHEITYEEPPSVLQISSNFLKSPSASIGIWVYLHPFGEGIRKLINNRYIIGHDTNYGKKKETPNGNRYINVFSFCRGPGVWKPLGNPWWKLWLTNGEGTGYQWRVDDTIDLPVGWHHFLIRWDHNRPLIEVVIDGTISISATNYKKYWPNNFCSTTFLGCWQNRWKEHYIETKLWRIVVSEHFLDDFWIEEELNLEKP
jgi:hypothetical protein